LDIRSEVETQIECLWTEQQKTVIRMRFGFDDGQYKTLREIANHLGITPERIRQIEHKALRILRHPSHSRGFRGLKYPDKPFREWAPEYRLLWAIYGQFLAYRR